MKFKSTLAMTIVLSAIGSYYFFVDIPEKKKQKEEKEKSEKIFLFDKGQAKSIAIIKADKIIQVENDNNTWLLKQPFSAKGDKTTAEALLTTLQNARFTRVVEENPSDLSLFGLKKPELEIILRLKDGNESVIQVGDEAPIGPLLYVKRRNEKRVLLCTTTRSDLDKSVYDLRDKTFIKASINNTTSIKIFNEESLAELTRKDKAWIVKGNGVSGAADASKVSNMINTLNQARIKSFVDENPSDLSVYGFKKPFLRLMLSTKDQQKTMLIGSATDHGTLYAKMEQNKNVFTVKKTLVESLSSKPLDYFTNVLVDFDQSKIKFFELKTNNKEIRIVRDDQNKENWMIERPLKTKADSATVNSMLFNLKAARIAKYVQANAMTFKPFGLAEPQKTFRLETQNGAYISFQLGNETNNGKLVFGKRDGESNIFLLEQGDVEKVFRSLHDFRDKKLLSFDNDNINKIQLTYPDKTFELIKQDDSWNLLRPEMIEGVKDLIVQNILWTLGHLEFAAIVKPKTSITEMESPLLVIKLWDHDGNELEVLSVNEPVSRGKYYFAKAKSHKNIYEIQKRFLDEISRDLDKFKP